MQIDDIEPGPAPAAPGTSQSTSTAATAIPPDELRRMQQRSDTRGLVHLAGHLGAIGGTGALYAVTLARGAAWPLVGLAAVAHGFTLVTMFATMHECVHRTAFRSQALNDGVGWFAGLLAFYNSTFYRYYHGWHHRFTQLPGKDPELDDPKPTGFGSYALELAGYHWWRGKITSYAQIARGRVGSYGFLNDKTCPLVVRSVRLQLAVYGTAIALSLALGRPLFVLHWLLPVALGQPLLRAILLAEHTGCSQDDDALTNTRTTHTIWPVRFLMWNMPFHAEHHRYPALPFFVLGDAHQRLGPRLRHVARRGYLGMHVEFLAGLRRRPRLPERG
jgi:fatty acid desaturase